MCIRCQSLRASLKIAKRKMLECWFSAILSLLNPTFPAKVSHSSHFYLLSSFATCSYIIFCQFLVLFLVSIFWFRGYWFFLSFPAQTVEVPSQSQASRTVFCSWLTAHRTHHQDSQAHTTLDAIMFSVLPMTLLHHNTLMVAWEHAGFSPHFENMGRVICNKRPQLTGLHSTF